MRTIAQFAIKDMDSTVLGPPGTSGGENPSLAAPGGDPHHHRDSLGSLRSAGGGPLYHPSSLRNVEPAPRITEEDYSYPTDNNRMSMAPPPAPAPRPAPPPDPVEMPADEEPSKQDYANRISIAAFPHGYDLPDFEHFNDEPEEEEPPPAVGRKPGMMTTYQRVTSSGSGMGPQVRYLPGVDGRESFDGGGGSGGGGVRGAVGEEDDEWTRDAKMSMNLAGRLGRGGG